MSASKTTTRKRSTRRPSRGDPAPPFRDELSEVEVSLGLMIPAHGPPTSPGEMLEKEFLEPLGISQSRAARALGISWPRMNEIVRAKRPVTVDTALRLARWLGTTAQFWLNLQTGWDAYWLLRDPAVREGLEHIEPLRTEDQR